MKVYLLAGAALALIAAPANARDNAAYFGIEIGGMFANDSDVQLDGNDFVKIDHKFGVDGDLIAGYDFGMVSWKSADESIADASLDDYVLNGQVDAIDSVRDLLGVDSVHTIGYCVAGTTLAATLAYLQAKGEADKVASATFFTAQVDFAEAGDLKLFLGDETMGLLQQLTAEKGYLDGRYMRRHRAATELRCHGRVHPRTSHGYSGGWEGPKAAKLIRNIQRRVFEFWAGREP